MSKKDKLNINTNDSTRIIEQTAQTTAEKVVLEFQKKGMLKDSKQSAFQKTEILLYNYGSFQDAVKEKKLQIKEVRSHGIKHKSKSITSFSSGNNFSNQKDYDELEEEKILQLESSIKITKNLILVIDKALEKLHDDPYYEIIKLKYFEKKKGDEIAEYFNVETSTVSRNKNRLINVLKIYLFSDDVVNELFS
ncbi:hypothetical protein DSECCO2_439050 [anaerobic digester metagenome]